MKKVLRIILHYASFRGRAKRREFWLYMLVAVLLMVGVILLDRLWSLKIFGVDWDRLFLLLILETVLATTARRFHDMGYGAWLVLLHFVPFIGLFLVFFMACFPGEPYPNRFDVEGDYDVDYGEEEDYYGEEDEEDY